MVIYVFIQTQKTTKIQNSPSTVADLLALNLIEVAKTVNITPFVSVIKNAKIA